MAAPAKKILSGKQAIMDYIGCGKSAFESLLTEGLPATVIAGRWFAYAENIDEFFRHRTRVRMKTIPEDAE